MPSTQSFTTSSWDDTDSWAAFQAGNRAAFEAIYQAHCQALIAYGYKLTSDRAVIQDCMQDLFVELWESRSRLSPVRSVKHYLLKALRYKIIHHLQQSRTQVLDDLQVASDDETMEQQLLSIETHNKQVRQLTIAIGQLPKRQQEAINLRYYQELSNEEIADVMGVNYQSACKLIYTALRTLRETLHLFSLIPLLAGILTCLKNS